MVERRGRKLGRIDFGSATAEHYRKNILTPFLAYYLKGKGSGDIPEALTFRTGNNEWMRHDTWPPKRDVVERKLYLQKDGDFRLTRRRRQARGVR
jgi:predicted acyl esterase